MSLVDDALKGVPDWCINVEQLLWHVLKYMVEVIIKMIYARGELLPRGESRQLKPPALEHQWKVNPWGVRF